MACRPADPTCTATTALAWPSAQKPVIFPMALLIHVSLSRLNHWLPWREAHPEVVEGTTEFHHDIADALFPEADA